MWHPEIEPIAYAAHSRLSPNAIATPSTPTAPVGKNPPVARIAVPGPPTTRISVPIASANAIRLCSVITIPFDVPARGTATAPPRVRA